MNSTLKPQESMNAKCIGFLFIGNVPKQISAIPYAILVVNVLILVLTFPFTAVLNTLVMFAVGKKAQLRTVSNVALACLSATDAMVGIFVQPMCIHIEISSLLKGELSGKTGSCSTQIVAKYAINFFCASSLVHIALMTAERYMAIKHTYNHSKVFTKTRVLMASTAAWIITATAHVLLYIDQSVFNPITSAFVGAILVFIIFSTVMVYLESRRHAKQIAEQQVSLEAREKFLKEKKALKVSTTIVFILIICYLPIMTLRVINFAFGVDKISSISTHVIFVSSVSLALINSFLNPLIYSVRLRQFRVAIIEIILGKNYTRAKNPGCQH